MSEDLIREWCEKTGAKVEDILHIVENVSGVFPMVVSANLTQNTYTLIKNDSFLFHDVPAKGCYDDLIEGNVENIHANYQKFFMDCFSRERLIDKFKNGKTDVYVELYQKNREDKYQWVSTHAIKIENADGDICHICLNRVLDGMEMERHDISR